MMAAPGTNCVYYVQCHDVWTCHQSCTAAVQMLIVMPVSWAAVSMSRLAGTCGDGILLDRFDVSIVHTRCGEQCYKN